MPRQLKLVFGNYEKGIDTKFSIVYEIDGNCYFRFRQTDFDNPHLECSAEYQLEGTDFEEIIRFLEMDKVKK